MLGSRGDRVRTERGVRSRGADGPSAFERPGLEKETRGVALRLANRRGVSKRYDERRHRVRDAGVAFGELGSAPESPMGRGKLFRSAVYRSRTEIAKERAQDGVAGVDGMHGRRRKSSRASARVRGDGQFHRELPTRVYGTVHGRFDDEAVEFVESREQSRPRIGADGVGEYGGYGARDVFEILRPRRAVVERNYCQREHARLSDVTGESDRVRDVSWYGGWEATI